MSFFFVRTTEIYLNTGPMVTIFTSPPCLQHTWVPSSHFPQLCSTVDACFGAITRLLFFQCHSSVPFSWNTLIFHNQLTSQGWRLHHLRGTVNPRSSILVLLLVHKLHHNHSAVSVYHNRPCTVFRLHAVHSIWL